MYILFIFYCRKGGFLIFVDYDYNCILLKIINEFLFMLDYMDVLMYENDMFLL